MDLKNPNKFNLVKMDKNYFIGLGFYLDYILKI